MEQTRIVREAVRSTPLYNFANYKKTVQDRSQKTVDEYLCDMRLFFKFVIAQQNDIEVDSAEFEKIDLFSADDEFVKTIKATDIYDFLDYLSVKRGDSSRTRARKLSSIKSFFRYIVKTEKLLKINPSDNIELAKIKKDIPKFLTLDESKALLNAILDDSSSKTRKRDFAIVMFFLNTGMRLSELVSVNLESFDENMTCFIVSGKGRKERTVYINDGARNAIKDYLFEREMVLNRTQKVFPSKNTPLFLSSRGDRISVKTVQWMTGKYFEMAGLGYKQLSTHKLRHTAATLMFREGVDVRILQEILGHEQLNTTQIYTHVVSEDIEDAVAKNPLADFKTKK